MLESMGTKDRIVLYHIECNIILNCLTINGVTGCNQLKCWLIGIGLVIELSCGWICCTCTPTSIIGVLIPQAIEKISVIFSSISSTYHRQMDNSQTHVQLVDNMHMLMQLQ